MRPRAALGWLRALLAVLVLLGLVWRPAHAEPEPPVTLERTADGLYLSARLAVDISPGLEDVLLRGVPVQFVWDAVVWRPRWYWTDRRVASATRTVRVVYQPLTRRWRVSVASGPVDDAGRAPALHQNVETLAEALAAVRRVTHWRLAPAQAVADGDTVALQFRVDGGLIPRPFPVGPGDEWGWVYQVRLPVPPVSGAAVPEPAHLPAEAAPTETPAATE